MKPMTDSPRGQRGAQALLSIPFPARRLLWLTLAAVAGLVCLLLIPGVGSKSALAQTPSEVEYSVTFKGMWSLQSTPGGVVGGAHFTTVIGAVHNSSVTYWRSGGMATSGVENVAELGATGAFRSEINASGNNKLSIIQESPGSGPEGSNTFGIAVTSDYPLVTLLSMIGPSPDWFVGISGLSLLDGNGNWRAERVVNLYPYDAGTEEGEEFSLSNPATNPEEPISSIRGIGKFSNQPMAKLTFTLKTRPPPPPPSATAPGKPPTPVVTPGNTQLTVRWSPPSDNGGAAITSYDLQHRRRGAWVLVRNAWRSGGGALVHTISNLLNGVTYDILVRAVNSVGEGPWSNIASGTPVNPNATLSPLIEFSPSRPVFFVDMIGDVPASRKLQVWNIRPGPMRFNVSDNADWLTLDPLSGSSSGPSDDEEIDISVDTSDLELGYHRATIEISGSGIENSPQRVRVELAIGASSFSTSTSYGSGASTSGSIVGDFAERLVIPQDSLPSGTTIAVAKLEVLPEGAPSNIASKVVWSVNVKAYPTGSDTPYMEYAPSGVELWLGMPSDDQPACSEDRAKLYSVTDGSWELVEHRCETDEEDRTYAASSLMSVITLALAIEMNYDANRDGRIDRDEVITAIIDYFAGRIDRDRVLRVIQRYFSSQ